MSDRVVATPCLLVVHLRAVIATGVALCVLVGCGRPHGPQRYRVSGNVTFDGKPLPQGRIAFDPVEPVTFDGKRIGGGFAPIRDGLYSTDTYGRGHLGGPHRIVITGHAATPLDPTATEPVYPPLFAPYETVVDLPNTAVVRDFTVPAPKP